MNNATRVFFVGALTFGGLYFRKQIAIAAKALVKRRPERKRTAVILSGYQHLDDRHEFIGS